MHPRRRHALQVHPSDKSRTVKLAESPKNKFIYGVDYDFEDNKIFYTERVEHAVYVADFNGATTSLEVSSNTVV